MDNFPDLTFEKKYLNFNRRTIGVDEVGRGCLAGPVVAAAVMLPLELIQNGIPPESFWSEVNDSKKCNLKKRKKLAELIKQTAEVQIAWCFSEEIDSINILQASMLAMRRAAMPFAKVAQVVLVDGNQDPFSDYFLSKTESDFYGNVKFSAVETIVKGDSHSISIAAASIVAKVYRDEWMDEFDRQFPEYKFSQHKGYSTKVHMDALQKLGPCRIHRFSFAPVKNYSA